MADTSSRDVVPLAAAHYEGVQRLLGSALPIRTGDMMRRVKKEWRGTSFVAVRRGGDADAGGTDADVVEGMLIGTFPKPTTAYVVAIAVTAVRRGEGVGKQLLRHFESFAAARRGAGGSDAATRIELHVQTANTDAIAFYKAVGYTVGGTVANYYRRARDPAALCMARTIDVPTAGIKRKRGDDEEREEGDADTALPAKRCCTREKGATTGAGGGSHPPEAAGGGASA